MTTAGKALTLLPVVLSQLDADGKDMLTTILQAAIECSYEQGFKDGKETPELKAKGEKKP